MKYKEGIDYDTWWSGLDLLVRRQLEQARRDEVLTRRHNEVRDYTVAVIWTDVGLSQGPSGANGPVTWAMIHPAKGEGFQCEAEALTFAIEQEAAVAHRDDVVIHISTRVRWKDGDKLKNGTHSGLPTPDDELADPARVKQLVAELRAKWKPDA